MKTKNEIALRQTIDLLNIADTYLQEGDMDLYYKFICNIRNPIIHERKGRDCKVVLDFAVDTRTIPDYDGTVPVDEIKYVNSHLVGMRNAVMIISKFKLHEKWSDVTDYMNTIKALQPILNCPVSLDKIVKHSNKWNFDYDNIEESIFWNFKLKQAGIKYLLDDEGKKVPVNQIWKRWYNNVYMPFVGIHTNVQ